MIRENLNLWLTSKIGRHTPIYIWLLFNLILGITSGFSPLRIALIIAIWSVGYILALKLEQIKAKSMRPKILESEK